ncbi:hypothetical protein GF325_04250, partial [Candidatus Bathyarchaeota archaeon]|nr:hypothetical protein [Candidatus Bathyarchaeota archaeon]
MEAIMMDGRFGDYFQHLCIDADEAVVGILNVLQDESAIIAERLNAFMVFDPTLNIITCIPQNINLFPGNVVHVIVTGQSMRPVENAKVSMVLERDGWDSGYQATDETGSVDIQIDPSITISSSQYVTIKVSRDGKKRVHRTFVNGYPVNGNGKKDVLLTIMTNLARYRPGDDLHARGIAWVSDDGTVTPGSGIEVLITLVDPSGNPVAKVRKTTDHFGVFAVTFPTEPMCPEGMYDVVIELPSLDWQVTRSVNVSGYETPRVDITLMVPDQVMIGETIRVSGKATYFYGDPVKDGSCELRLLDLAGDVIQSHLSELDATEGGTFEQKFIIDTGTVSPGQAILEAIITGSDGRLESVSRSIMIEPAPDATRDLPGELDVVAWDFDATQVAGYGLKIMIVNEGNPSLFSEMPVHVMVISMKGKIKKAHSEIVKGTREIPIMVPLSEEIVGLHHVEVFILPDQSTLLSKEHPVMIIPTTRLLNLSIEGPRKAQPNHAVHYEISTKFPREARGDVLLGACMVDKAAISAAGATTSHPFQDMEGDIDFKGKIEFVSTLQDTMHEFYILVDDIFAEIFSSWHDLISLLDLCTLLETLVASPLLFDALVQHHIKNFYHALNHASHQDIVNFAMQSVDLDLSFLDWDTIHHHLADREDFFLFLDMAFSQVREHGNDASQREPRYLEPLLRLVVGILEIAFNDPHAIMKKMAITVMQAMTPEDVVNVIDEWFQELDARGIDFGDAARTWAGIKDKMSELGPSFKVIDQTPPLSPPGDPEMAIKSRLLFGEVP